MLGELRTAFWDLFDDDWACPFPVLVLSFGAACWLPLLLKGFVQLCVGLVVFLRLERLSSGSNLER